MIVNYRRNGKPITAEKRADAQFYSVDDILNLFGKLMTPLQKRRILDMFFDTGMHQLELDLEVRNIGNKLYSLVFTHDGIKYGGVFELMPNGSVHVTTKPPAICTDPLAAVRANIRLLLT